MPRPFPALALLLVLVVPAGVVSKADAESPAPVCFAMSGTGATTFQVVLAAVTADLVTGTGTDGAGTPLVANVVIGSSAATVSLIVGAGVSLSARPYFVVAPLDLSTLTGLGRCESINGGICGTGVPISLSVVACD